MSDKEDKAYEEMLIEAAKRRLESYQTAHGGKRACIENAQAIALLEDALVALNNRRKSNE